MGSFLVTPAHTPSAIVVVKNLGEDPYNGVVAVEGPEGWSLEPESQQVSLEAGQTRRLRFLVKRGLNLESNSYPLTAKATGAGATITRRQQVVAASAPYFKPTIDGNVDDWGDAIPVAWVTGGKKTVVCTYWNRRRFSLLVSVEEERLAGLEESSPSKPFDAVQVALSSEDAVTGSSTDEEANRYEFLFVSCEGTGGGRCYQLSAPGAKLGELQEPRDLAGLQYEDAEVAVSRSGGLTHYECSIPFRPMSDQIRPSEGREFRLSVLVHDPDGTGIRDWGEGAGLWPWERNRLAWSNWPGAKWGDKPPFDSKTPWGLCSSKY
jgi:hypothetical protein